MTRLDALALFGLPNHDAFEMEPAQLQGVWRIRVSRQGMEPIFMDLGIVTKLAVVLRNIDPDLSTQCEAAVREAQRRARNPN